jgi:hypothetical protein
MCPLLASSVQICPTTILWETAELELHTGLKRAQAGFEPSFALPPFFACERRKSHLFEINGREIQERLLATALSLGSASTERSMTKLRLLGAAAVALSSALASPVMAQEVIYNPGYCAQFYPNANCQNKGPGNPYTGDYQRRMAYRNWNNGWNSYDSWYDNRWDRRYSSGFWPVDVAAGVVGGAIGTAGAIATAPLRGDSYAYYNRGAYYNPGNSYAYYNSGYRGGYNNSYATRNGFFCQPGTWFKGEDGRRHLCR